jgi:hypothetical protein
VPREAPPRSGLVIKLVLSMALPDVDPQSVMDIQRQATLMGLRALIQAKTDAEGDLGALLVAEAAISTPRQRCAASITARPGCSGLGWGSVVSGFSRR